MNLPDFRLKREINRTLSTGYPANIQGTSRQSKKRQLPASLTEEFFEKAVRGKRFSRKGQIKLLFLDLLLDHKLLCVYKESTEIINRARALPLAKKMSE